MSKDSGLDNERAEAGGGGGLCPIVMACDEGFAMPLATALRSLCESNERHWPLQVHILTDCFSQEMRQRVADSLPDGAAALRWVEVDLDLFMGWPLPTWLTPISLARFSIPELFKGRAGRVLYLDADLLVFGDLAGLCNTDMDGAPIAAVTDIYIDPDLKAGRIEHWADVPKVENYFNSGVLLFDVGACIRHGLTRRATDYLSANRASPYPDQDALNVACDRAWKALDSRWNFQGHCMTLIPIEKLPASQRPEIVHFLTRHKPWIPRSCSVNAKLYNRYRARTRFRRSLSEAVLDAGATLDQRIRHHLQPVRSLLRRIRNGLLRVQRA